MLVFVGNITTVLSRYPGQYLIEDRRRRMYVV